MSLRERWRSDVRIRRGVRGALAGAAAGITVTATEAVGPSSWLLAFFVGAVVFVALHMLMER